MNQEQNNYNTQGNNGTTNNPPLNTNQIVGYDSQTGQPIYENQSAQQFINQQNVNPILNNNQINYQTQTQQNIQQSNLASENLKKCRKILHNDSVILFVVNIISLIASFLFLGFGEESAAWLFVESILYLVFLIILVCNKKELKKSIGVLAIIVSSFMFLFGIINHSLFDIIYIILGIFFIIHSIKYLKEFKGYVPVKEVKEKLKIDKLKNISLILIIICAIYPLLVLFLSGLAGDNMQYFFDKSISIVLFICALTSLILNIILFIKKRRSAALYICLIFSIIIVLLSGNYVIDSVEKLFSHYTSYDSEQDKQYLMEKTESIIDGSVESLLFNGSVIGPLPNTSDAVLINKDIVNVKEWTSIIEENEKKGYYCDSYIELQRFYSEKECMDYINDSISCNGYNDDYKKGSIHVKSFIKCTGKYEYQTTGFDGEKLNKSKNNKKEYIELGFKQLEYDFNEAVLQRFKGKLEFNNITQQNISKRDYELEIMDIDSNGSIFSKTIYKDYVCDGYVDLSLDVTTNEYVGRPYINCTGEYNYQTEGYDNTKLTN